MLPGVEPVASPLIPEPTPVSAEPARDPAWDGWDLLRLTIISILALFASLLAALVVSKRWAYPYMSWADLAHNALIAIIGQAVGYLIILLYMFLLVTKERGQPNFWKAIHWNWPARFTAYVIAGIILSFALQAFAHLLPIPKDLPIDRMFQTPQEAWMLTIFGITLAPLMEELLFRGFFYPVIARRMGVGIAVLLTSAAFAALHGSQLMFAWGPVLIIFLVGLVLTIVRARQNSVAAGLIIHMAYNATLSGLLFIATDGFRHLEKMNQ
jgi:hypothetical protein